MKLDTFVKVTLVVIALFLGIIAIKPFFEVGSASANPGGKFDYIQIWVSGMNIEALAGKRGEQGLILFDSRSGELWAYSFRAFIVEDKPYYIGKLAELGKPLIVK